MVSTFSSAVPVRVIVQDVSPGAVALPAALQVRLMGLVSVPWAVPLSFSSPAHVALKFPFAVVAVCSVTSHLKSVHALGDGIRFDDVQLPRNAPLPAADGDVRLLVCSTPMQPVAVSADSESIATRIRFFMFFISVTRPAVCKRRANG